MTCDVSNDNRVRSGRKSFLLLSRQNEEKSLVRERNQPPVGFYPQAFEPFGQIRPSEQKQFSPPRPFKKPRQPLGEFVERPASNIFAAG